MADIVPSMDLQVQSRFCISPFICIALWLYTFNKNASYLSDSACSYKLKRRGGKTTKVPDFRAAITVTTLTMNENAFSLPKTVDFTPRTEPLKFCRFRPILAIFSESVK